MRIIALKKIHKTLPGGVIDVTSDQAKVLVAMGFATDQDVPVDDPPRMPVSVAKRRYQRKDLRAEA